ncbi:MAG: hypothetical protein H0W63_09175 [Gemmatimonadaceae bacterium]|nr:hypothetical protein [Gemmatimonadaceae bacterium]
MKASRFALTVILMLAVGTTAASAQTATQTVTFAVTAVNTISFTGAPSLSVTPAAVGSSDASVSDATSTWAVTTNQSLAKVSAQINLAMPANVTLKANLQAPTVGLSNGAVTLGITSVDLVTGITKQAQSGLTATYVLTATAAADPVSSNRVVTYTISGGS